MSDKTTIDPTRLWEIHGKYYDLEPFMDEHPGGRRFLEQSRGLDCTALFESIHVHDKLPKAQLERFYVADVPDFESEFDWSPEGFYPTLKERVRKYLREDAKARGVKVRDIRTAHHGTRTFLIRLVGFAVVFIAVSVGALGFGQWWCALLWGPLAFTLGGYGHEAMHAGVFPSVRANRILAWFTLDLQGLSSYVFTGTHVPLHHIWTNVEGIDPDIEVHFPLTRERESQPRYFFHRVQHFYSWIVYFGTLPFLWVADIFAVLTGTWFGPFGKIQKPSRIELTWFFVFKALSLGLWYVLPYFLLSWPMALAFNFLMIGGAGMMVQGTFALSHQNEIAMNLEHRVSKHPKDWGALQLESTVDFDHGHWLPTAMTAGLGYQIEHHLFPTLSYSRLPDIAPIVKQACEEFDVPYFYYPTTLGALAAHYRFLRRMGEPVRALAADPLGEVPTPSVS